MNDCHARVIFLFFVVAGQVVAAEPTMEDSKPVKRLVAPDATGEREARRVAYSPDGVYLATGHIDDTVALWRLGTGRETLRTVASEGSINAGKDSIGFSPDGKRLVTAGPAGVVYVWDLPAGKVSRKIESDKNAPNRSFGLAPDGKSVAILSSPLIGPREYVIRLCDIESGKSSRSFRFSAGERSEFVNSGIAAPRFSPDGKIVAAAARDTVIRLWAAESGKELGELKGHRATPVTLAFSPDGRILASGAGGKTAFNGRIGDPSVRLWDVVSGKELFRFDCEIPVESVAYSPDVAVHSVRRAERPERLRFTWPPLEVS
ncbi:MAG: hypothetical protein K2R98_24070, partial [Gemmataceae bacterium]|nr:hypothetical protein [Gemmataceae bacterium]